MSANGDGIDESLAERLARNEPIREPELLQSLQEANLPLRGPLRQRIVENMTEQVRNRRTIEGISNRAAANIAAPISGVIEQSIQQRVHERVQQSVTRIVANSQEGK